MYSTSRSYGNWELRGLQSRIMFRLFLWRQHVPGLQSYDLVHWILCRKLHGLYGPELSKLHNGHQHMCAVPEQPRRTQRYLCGLFNHNPQLHKLFIRCQCMYSLRSIYWGGRRRHLLILSRPTVPKLRLSLQYLYCLRWSLWVRWRRYMYELYRYQL